MTLQRPRAALLALTMGVGGLSAAEPTTTGTIQLDVVVTDRQGRPIRDLLPSDFEVRESGEQRPIVSAAMQREPGRVVGIFFDEYHVAAGAHATRARDALLRFLDAQLRADDRIALMKPLDPLGTIRTTGDFADVHAAVAALDGRRGDYLPRSPFEEQFISRAPAAASRARAQMVTTALQALVGHIGETRAGRKALVLVSEGFAPFSARSGDRSLGALRAIVFLANRHGVAIHVLNPALPSDGPEESSGQTHALEALAAQTGGTLSAAGTDLSDVLKRALDDLDHHYVVTYRPAAVEDGKYHPISVRVTRPGAFVRARTGYWARHAVIRKAETARAPAFVARPARPSPYIRPWIGTSRASQGLMNVTVTWEPGQAPPRNQAIAGITLKAVDGYGRVLYDASIDGPAIDDGGAVKTPPGRGLFTAPAGPIALEMKIRNRAGAILDTDYRTIQVPNLWAARTTFATVQIIRTQTARAFIEARSDPVAVPTGSRQFSRTERLLVRTSAYGVDGSNPKISARLLNQRGSPMRDLPEVTDGLPEGILQFDLPLASLAPGEYRVELSATTGSRPRPEATELIVFRVTN